MYIQIVGETNYSKIINNLSLIFEILVALQKTGDFRLKEINNISELSVEKEYPDYIVEIKNAKIKIVEEI